MNTNNYSKIKNPEELCDLLGLPKTQAKRAEIKADLAVAISKIINEKGWTHKEASEISGVGRTVITSIVMETFIVFQLTDSSTSLATLD